MQARVRTVRVADLLGSKIVTADGRKVGHVVDIRVTRGPRYRVTALEFGAAGLLDRLHVLGALWTPGGGKSRPRAIPWEDIARYDGSTFTLKAGRAPEG
jgi:sporulation protein YlmC with PRC-barrel domain